jgi:hypothetical protein
MRRRKKRPDSSGLKTDRSVAVANCSAPLTPTPRAGARPRAISTSPCLARSVRSSAWRSPRPSRARPGRPTGTAAPGRAACRSSRKTRQSRRKAVRVPLWCRFMVPALRSNSPAEGTPSCKQVVPWCRWCRAPGGEGACPLRARSCELPHSASSSSTFNSSPLYVSISASNVLSSDDSRATA